MVFVMNALFRENVSKRISVIARVALALGLAAGFSACMFDGSEGIPSNPPMGYVRFDLRLGRTDKPLGKSATADTTFELDSVRIVLSASGAVSQAFSYPISGRSDLAALPVSLPAYPVAALRNWKAMIYSIDTTLNPARRDTVHIDSVFFGVPAGDTAAVTKTVSPAFSILRARFVSNQADSIAHGMRFVRLRVNGVTRDSLDLSSIAGHLNAVHFASTSVGYAVGDGGALRKTTNGGSDWSSPSSGTTQNLRAVWFASATTGWVGGDNGLIRKTTDGANWTAQSSGTTQPINRLYFADASNGWAFGDAGTMLRTVDGGANWVELSGWGVMTSGTTTALRGIDFVDANVGYVVGGGGLIRKTLNGGWTWTAQASGTGAVLNAVSVSGSVGVAAGSGGAITYTSNGGANWSAVTSGSTAYYAAYTSGTRHWVAGDNGAVRYSTNGSTWTPATNTGSTNYRGVFFRSNSLGWVVGAQGVIRKTTTSNYNSWTLQGSGVTTQTLNGVWFVDDNTGWAVGDAGTVLRTTNGGANWLASTAGSQTLTGVWFANTTTGYVSGHGGAIYKSTNGGASWTAHASGTTQNLNAIHGANANEVWTAGDSGVIARASRGGAAVTTQNLNGAYFRNDTGYVVGDAGTALRTIDGGDTWTALTGAAAGNINGVFSTGNYAYLVGDAGRIYTVPHDGTTTALTSRTSNTTANLYGVWGSPTVGSTRMYAVGAGGDIRYITSASSAWSALSSGTTETLRGIQCSGASVACWTVGTNETVLKSANGTSWAAQGGGVREFDELLAYKYLKPGVSATVVLQAIDQVSPVRGYQATLSLNVGAGVDSTVNTGLTRCGYGGSTPACAP
jgi:photosystem II stability/assembly factor-like uncharacterized protein